MDEDDSLLLQQVDWSQFGEGPARHCHRDVEMKVSPAEGHGVFAKTHIPKGTIVYCAPLKDCKIYRLDDFHRMMQIDPEGAKELFQVILRYGYQIEEDAFTCALSMEEAEKEISNFWNHSCDPNCWLVGPCVWATRRDVAEGEEMTLDYATFDVKLGGTVSCCGCGSDLCRGGITAEDYKIAAVQKRYKGHFMPFIERRINALHAAEEQASAPAVSEKMS